MSERRRVPIDQAGQPVVEVPEDIESEAQESCDCPRLDPEDWDAVESDWSDVAFLKGLSSAVLGVPTGLTRTRDELRARAGEIGATLPEDAMVLLGPGRFRRPVLLELDNSPDHREVYRPGGIAYTRLVEAPLGTIRKLVRDAELEARVKYGRCPDATWLWYLTCRVCSHERNFDTLIVTHYRDPK